MSEEIRFGSRTPSLRLSLNAARAGSSAARIADGFVARIPKPPVRIRFPALFEVAGLLGVSREDSGLFFFLGGDG
jgi:hypothetical protein